MAIDSLARQLIGVEIGSYRITELIGFGGMGAVFLAVHKTLNLRVAIKVMLQSEQVINTVDAQRFLGEARALSAVKHSGLVKLHDVGTLPDGKIYMMMELLEGESLHERLKRLRGSLPIAAAVELTRQLAAALHVVHQRGIIHRDLKPENIFLVADPDSLTGERTKLLDFGIAKFRDAVDRRTKTGEPIGTPRYMSPEQCESSTLIDERTDVYSLGLLLYQMATGDSPYALTEDSPLAWLYAHVERRPRALGQLNPDAPAELEALVVSMLDKIPLQRPSMAAVQERLKAIGQQMAPPPKGVLPPLPAHVSDRGFVRVPTLPLSSALTTRRRWFRWALPGVLGAGVLGFVFTDLFHREPSLLRHLASRLASSRPVGPGPAAEVAGAVPAVQLAQRIAASGGPSAEADVDDAVAATRTPAAMAFIRGATFPMGSTPEEAKAYFLECEKSAKDCKQEEFDRQLSKHLVKVSSFYIGKYEITNQQYADFLNLPSLQPILTEDRYVLARTKQRLVDLDPTQGGLEFSAGKYRPRSGFADLPVVQVSWYGASQYCASRGYRLPTEAQWELAAHGLVASSARPSPWPWGDAPPHCDGVVMARGGGGVCAHLKPGPQPVGTATQDVTPQGVFDLGGNVREWVQDRFAVPYPACGTCIDTVVRDVQDDPDAPIYRSIRGGSWHLDPTMTRATARGRWQEDRFAFTLGFRCAAAVAR